MATVTLRDLHKSFGEVEIIKGVDLDVEDREFVVFVGPSGCRKSTLLRMIAGLEEITSGDLAIDGERVNDVPPAERGLAMVFQTYALYPHMSVADNMAFSLRRVVQCCWHSTPAGWRRDGAQDWREPAGPIRQSRRPPRAGRSIARRDQQRARPSSRSR